MSRRWSQLAIAVGLAVLAAGCGAKSYKPGTLGVSVSNRGDRAVSDVSVLYGSDRLDGYAIAAGGVVRERFLMQPKTSLRLQFTDPDGRRLDKTYEVHARPEDGGEVQFRIDRDGNVQPVGRFDIYHKK